MNSLEDLVTLITSTTGRLWLAGVLGAVGLWLLMPSARISGRAAGAAALILSALILFSLAPPLGTDAQAILFWILTAVALTSAVGTITSRSPLYSAIWFAVTLLGVGGLMLVNGAVFLGVATVAVYAGAIVVTFLFVLMLAQPQGHAFYDRMSWGRMGSALGCMAGVGLACALVWGNLEIARSPDLAGPISGDAAGSVLAESHVAVLGGRLFSQHLIGVELAGTLLLAALVGAVAMAGQGGRLGRPRGEAVHGGVRREGPS
jgi:NADH-quinone oxidoreductase subunit J